MGRSGRHGAHALLICVALELLAGCSSGRPAPATIATAPEPAPRYRVTLARSPFRRSSRSSTCSTAWATGPGPATWSA